MENKHTEQAIDILLEHNLLKNRNIGAMFNLNLNRDGYVDTTKTIVKIIAKLLEDNNETILDKVKRIANKEPSKWLEKAKTRQKKIIK